MSELLHRIKRTQNISGHYYVIHPKVGRQNTLVATEHNSRRIGCPQSNLTNDEAPILKKTHVGFG